MRKYFAICLALVIFSSCGVIEYKNLKSMEDSVRQHIRYNDQENNIHTNVKILEAISYRKLEDGEKQTDEDYYLCRVYLRAKWSYLVGERVYNVSDTVDAYFNRDKVILRIGDKKKEIDKKEEGDFKMF